MEECTKAVMEYDKCIGSRVEKAQVWKKARHIIRKASKQVEENEGATEIK